MPLLFVYGSLKRDASAHHLLNGASFIKEASLLGYEIKTLPDGWIGAVPGKDHVKGELYEVAEDSFAALDEYEGAEYQRIQVCHGTIWVYVLCRF